MNPRMYNVQTAMDASFAVAQQGNEGSSTDDEVMIDDAYAEAMSVATVYDGALDHSASAAHIYARVLKKIKEEQPIPVSKKECDD